MLKTQELRRKNVMRYLLRREEKLRQIHPQWDFNQQKISASTGWATRTGQPICIPPSWDVIKTYAGPVDKLADGYNSDFYKYGLKYFGGDHGDAAVLELMRASKLGGLVIGNIDSQHMLREEPVGDSKTQDYLLPKELRDIVEEALRECVPLPLNAANTQRPANEDEDNSSQSDENEEVKPHFFEIDFVFIHPTFGLYPIEVKNASRQQHEKDQTRRGFTQLCKSISILKALFVKFCALLFSEENVEQLWNNFNANGALILVPGRKSKPSTSDDGLGALKLKYKQFDFLYNNVGKLESKVATTIRSDNFFQHDVFKYFAVFLSCFRPDFFISPALCALQTYASIVTQKISALRFYHTDDDYDRAKGMRFDISAQQAIAKYANLQKETREKLTQEYLRCNMNEFHKMIKSTEIRANQVATEFAYDLHQNVNQQVQAGSQMSQVIGSHVERIFDTFVKPNNIETMMKGLKKDVCRGRVNSLDMDAHSAAHYLFNLKKKGYIKHSDIAFPDGRREIYFTQKQLDAINIFTKNGNVKSQPQIITGAPGSGKSLILMMKLFLLKQVRPHKKLAFASWFKHDYVVKDFLKCNACTCCRKVEFFTEHGLTKRLLGKDRPVVKFRDLERGVKVEDERFNETRDLSRVLASLEYDVVLDERHDQNSLERFKASGNIFADVISIAAITGGYKLLSNEPAKKTTRSFSSTFTDSAFSEDGEEIRTYPAWMEEKNLVEPLHLDTVFRSTNHIKRYVVALLEDQKAISGHSFEGVPIEEYFFETEERAIKAACSCIKRLNKLLGNFTGTRKIALIAEDLSGFPTCPAFVSCLRHVELPLRANEVPSLEFPIVITVCSCKSAPCFLPISASRAMCHLIVFKYERPRGSK